MVVRPEGNNGWIESENEELLYPGFIVDGEAWSEFDLNEALSNRSAQGQNSGGRGQALAPVDPIPDSAGFEPNLRVEDDPERQRFKYVQQCLQNARAFQVERNYQSALVELEAALFIDPNNTAVESLRDVIQDVSISTQSIRLHRRLDLKRANQQLINDDAIIPYDELLTYPGSWPELTQIRLAGLDDANLRTPTEVRIYDINAVLNQTAGQDREEQVAQIIEMIKDNVDVYGRWVDQEYTIRESNGSLIVKATGEAHQELLGLIEQFGFEAGAPAQAEHPAVPPVNPWVLTEHDAQSTFALDTDTASYELARRTIWEQAQLPPVAAVRMEEFVNRFDYQYPSGREAYDTFTVHAEAGPAPFAEDGVVLLKVGVRGRVVARDQMKPAHYVFVIDASGSMAREDRLPLVQQSLAMLLGQLGERDTVSLVSYETRPYLLLEHASASAPQAILDAAATIQTGGSTNLTEGLKLGYQVAAGTSPPGV